MEPWCSNLDTCGRLIQLGAHLGLMITTWEYQYEMQTLPS
jgi:hypothetical protein